MSPRNPIGVVDNLKALLYIAGTSCSHPALDGSVMLMNMCKGLFRRCVLDVKGPFAFCSRSRNLLVFGLEKMLPEIYGKQNPMIKKCLYAVLLASICFAQESVAQSEPQAPSATNNFFTLASDPTVPVQTAPTNGSTITQRSVTFCWTRPSGASSFHLQVGTERTFATGIVLDDGAVLDTTRTLNNLSNMTTYYWRVNADNVGGVSPWSLTFSFTVSAPPLGVVYLLLPADGALTSGDSTRLVWTSGGPLVDKYELGLAMDSLFTFKVIDSTFSILTDTTKVIKYLWDGGHYFWHVRAHNPGGWGPFTPVWSFTVSSTVPPSAPILVSPQNGATLNTYVRFVWRATSPNVTACLFELSFDSLGTPLMVDSSVVDTSRVVFGMARGTYWWRMKAKNNSGWGPFSGWSHFTILVTGVDEAASIPKDISLAQNFPNPFNPTTTIHYALPHRSHVTLTVYNTLGQAVATLVNGDIDAGSHTVQFDASNLASGVYFYRLTAGSYVDTKELLLVR